MNVILQLFLYSLIQVVLLISASSYTYAAPLPHVDAQTATKGVLRLSEWGSEWMTLTPLNKFSEDSSDLNRVTLPAYYHEHVSQRIDGIAQGYGTYAIRISNLSSVFQQPTFYLKASRDAWQVWWVEKGRTPIMLGENGRVGKTKDQQVSGHGIGYVQLPRDSHSGTLVVYVSAYLVNKSGLGETLSIVEHGSVMSDIMLGVAIDALVLGVGILIAVQNLVFYSRRRSDRAFLYLSIFTFTIIFRSIVTSPHIDLYLSKFAIQEFTLRFEYIVMLWAALAAAQFLLVLFRIYLEKFYTWLGYGIFIPIVIATFLIPLSTMSLNIISYQLVLLLLVCFSLILLGRALRLNLRGAKSLVFSSIPIMIAIIHDIASTWFAGYNVYISEYALILFLFIQTQFQLSRFIKALDVAKHLTANLKNEVDIKTRELSERNVELESYSRDLTIENKQVKLLSETDHLTGLFNRQTLEARSKEMFEQAALYGLPLSVAMMDLDHFKRINDEYGHAAGDECLIHIGSFLRAYQFRKRDLVARYGGEEIIIILSDISVKEAEKIIIHVCDGIAESPVYGPHDDLYLTASFGVADIEISGADSIDQLIQAADSAMYEAKKNGRNRVEVYVPATNEMNEGAV